MSHLCALRMSGEGCGETGGVYGGKDERKDAEEYVLK